MRYPLVQPKGNFGSIDGIADAGKAAMGAATRGADRAEMDAAWVVVGHDFRFGWKGEGTAERLQSYCAEHGLGCDVIPAVTLEGKVVSSTYIRDLISEGEMEAANRFLGHPHSLVDTVHYGYRLGTQMGTPTINMRFPNGVVVPA